MAPQFFLTVWDSSNATRIESMPFDSFESAVGHVDSHVLGTVNQFRDLCFLVRTQSGRVTQASWGTASLDSGFDPQWHVQRADYIPSAILIQSLEAAVDSLIDRSHERNDTSAQERALRDAGAIN